MRLPARSSGRRAWLGYLFLCTGILAASSVVAADPPKADAARGDGNYTYQVVPASGFDDAGLHAGGFGEITFQTSDGRRLSAQVYRATRFDPKTGPIWFVMHGARRDADRYLAAAAPVAERYGALAVAIEFSRRDYPSGDDYTLGVTTRGRVDERAYAQGRWRDPHDYLYLEVERVFEAVRRSLRGRQAGYYLFGHSAGAQFSHRLVTFTQGARVLGAVAANAGWYTLPARGDGAHLAMPYGLRGSPLDEADMRTLLAAPLTLLLGSRDTATAANDRMIRDTPEARAQGATRLARGQNYFETGRSSALALDAEFGWRLVSAPGAGHEVREVIASAGFLLFAPDVPHCRTTVATEAHGLVINELLADPPKGPRGDANGDGTRSAADDEFVELVNTGALPICLSGWTLSDASGRRRHLFPLAPALPPGKAVVVFGGGVPTGSFGDAEVQWASSGNGLSLSNAGDVLTLSDADGHVVLRLSWGDCAGQPCAADHRNGSLGVDGALVRWPEPTDDFQLHRDIAAAEYSPGSRADGTPWHPSRSAISHQQEDDGKQRGSR